MNSLIIVIFVIGYLAIISENWLKLNKAATALVTGVLCWTVYVLCTAEPSGVVKELAHELSEISAILFFLLGAMTVVELIDAHEGFNVITNRIKQQDKRILLWLMSFITFFLSAVLDNLTTTIVVVSLLRKLIKNDEDRLLFAGITVIAANAGGAWSPIGDVTTTMLWIGGQVTAANIVIQLLAPSLICLIVPLILVSFKLKGTVEAPVQNDAMLVDKLSASHQTIILIAGLGILILVPLFKTITHLPPYMGMLGGLGLLWILTEMMHSKRKENEKSLLSVEYALQRIDTPSILFFLGILMSIAVLKCSGLLSSMAVYMSNHIEGQNGIVMLFGLVSAVIDNVPLVAAAQGMYGLDQFPTDHFFWEFLAYCTGTGGSILVIGSAAGVAAMGMEKIGFVWYIKKISFLALLSYFSGALAFILQYKLTH